MATIYNKTALKKIKKDELVQMFLNQQAKLNDVMMEKQENKKLKEENKKIAELEEENKKLKDDLHYYRCFVNAVDPKCNKMNSIEKQDVDEYTTDEKLRKKLYESFNIDEDEDEDEDEDNIYEKVTELLEEHNEILDDKMKLLQDKKELLEKTNKLKEENENLKQEIKDSEYTRKHENSQWQKTCEKQDEQIWQLTEEVHSRMSKEQEKELKVENENLKEEVKFWTFKADEFERKYIQTEENYKLHRKSADIYEEKLIEEIQILRNKISQLETEMFDHVKNRTWPRGCGKPAEM
jgi:hypothetical protein